MYRDDLETDVFSKPVRAGKRTYFFDVKSTRGGRDFYLTITESKRRQERDGSFSFDKHKIFLYKEDFDKFADGLQEVVNYIRERMPAMPDNEAAGQAEQAGQPANSFSDVEFEEL